MLRQKDDNQEEYTSKAPRDELIQSINYAIKTGSFNKKRWVNSFKNVCVFGLGKYFDETFVQQNVQKRYNVNLLCDNNPKKLKTTYGISCISVDKLKEIENIIVIIMVGNSESLCRQLDDYKLPWVLYQELSMDDYMGIPEDTKWFVDNSHKILDVYDLLEDEKSKQVYATVLSNRIAHPIAESWYREVYSDDEYFYTDCFKLSDKEVYVDCGAYDGDTIQRFLQAVNYKYSHIYGFELDTKIYIRLKENVKSIKNITCINAGVWDTSGQINYGRGWINDLDEGISIYKRDTVVKGNVLDLDTSICEKNVTLLKMDIEGAEYRALKGGVKLIEKYHPKLAICLYHRLNDFWELPLLINKLVPEYKIFVRHHVPINEYGTVMYASID